MNLAEFDCTLYIMCESLKPDLVIHPRYAKSVSNFGLEFYFNILNLHDLESNIENINPILVSDDDVLILDDVYLSPVFKDSLVKRSGIKPYYTSLYFENEIPIYKIPFRAPRYVIWNTTDNLTICATYVDRVDKYSLYDACCRAKEWSYSITRSESIIVFDLDETLIDRDSKKLKGSDTALTCARSVYDRVVLYSHGSSLHVDDNVTKFDKSAFDLVLSNNTHDNTSNKNLLYLYNYFPNTIFTKATLVDDSLYNWTPEYDKIIVPFKLSHVNNIIPLLE
ncbi:38K protein [Oryctes rhinoceros nudivirus]|uniref:38K protein n=1 Tax=Oryctes rhinoceros nudivirus TaxID=92521 RepID=A0A6B9QQZ5_9VIRU|nr:38K protein [Oryctes rhinoceros nudivirus]ACH96217.1 38K protein [Oryctes rhinoceros nudivirus]QHG11320.1 38K protein [Oryctes rhinoceros nudivirus]QKE59551.1 38K protein [Oryctes rhinoceros nudivirus]UBO76498.1 38K protein [Oryctes rhinoceros nudivirus]UBR58264.1 38K protein [Oryctes rhinoceros nudivirus]